MTEALHVAPLPAEHQASSDCWCHPLPSATVGAHRLYVHRTVDGTLPEPRDSSPKPIDAPAGTQ